MDSQTKIRVENLRMDLGFTWYTKYAGNKSSGCILHWINIYIGLSMAERCCAHADKVTTSPYTSELVADYTWVEDSPNVFRPKFIFDKKYDYAQQKQELYEMYILNHEA